MGDPSIIEVDPRIAKLTISQIKDQLYLIDKTIVIPNRIKLLDLQILATQRLKTGDIASKRRVSTPRKTVSERSSPVIPAEPPKTAQRPSTTIDPEFLARVRVGSKQFSGDNARTSEGTVASRHPPPKVTSKKNQSSGDPADVEGKVASPDPTPKAPSRRISKASTSKSIRSTVSPQAVSDPQGVSESDLSELSSSGESEIKRVARKTVSKVKKRIPVKVAAHDPRVNPAPQDAPDPENMEPFPQRLKKDVQTKSNLPLQPLKKNPPAKSVRLQPHGDPLPPLSGPGWSTLIINKARRARGQTDAIEAQTDPLNFENPMANLAKPLTPKKSPLIDFSASDPSQPSSVQYRSNSTLSDLASLKWISPAPIFDEQIRCQPKSMCLLSDVELKSDGAAHKANSLMDSLIDFGSYCEGPIGIGKPPTKEPKSTEPTVAIGLLHGIGKQPNNEPKTAEPSVVIAPIAKQPTKEPKSTEPTVAIPLHCIEKQPTNKPWSAEPSVAIPLHGIGKQPTNEPRSAKPTVSIPPQSIAKMPPEEPMSAEATVNLVSQAGCQGMEKSQPAVIRASPNFFDEAIHPSKLSLNQLSLLRQAQNPSDFDDFSSIVDVARAKLQASRLHVDSSPSDSQIAANAPTNNVVSIPTTAQSTSTAPAAICEGATQTVLVNNKSRSSPTGPQAFNMLISGSNEIKTLSFNFSLPTMGQTGPVQPNGTPNLNSLVSAPGSVACVSSALPTPPADYMFNILPTVPGPLAATIGPSQSAAKIVASEASSPFHTNFEVPPASQLGLRPQIFKSAVASSKCLIVPTNPPDPTNVPTPTTGIETSTMAPPPTTCIKTSTIAPPPTTSIEASTIAPLPITCIKSSTSAPPPTCMETSTIVPKPNSPVSVPGSVACVISTLPIPPTDSRMFNVSPNAPGPLFATTAPSRPAAKMVVSEANSPFNRPEPTVPTNVPSLTTSIETLSIVPNPKTIAPPTTSIKTSAIAPPPTTCIKASTIAPLPITSTSVPPPTFIETSTIVPVASSKCIVPTSTTDQSVSIGVIKAIEPTVPTHVPSPTTSIKTSTIVANPNSVVSIPDSVACVSSSKANSPSRPDFEDLPASQLSLQSQNFESAVASPIASPSATPRRLPTTPRDSASATPARNQLGAVTILEPLDVDSLSHALTCL